MKLLDRTRRRFALQTLHSPHRKAHAPDPSASPATSTMSPAQTWCWDLFDPCRAGDRGLDRAVVRSMSAGGLEKQLIILLEAVFEDVVDRGADYANEADHSQ